MANENSKVTYGVVGLVITIIAGVLAIATYIGAIDRRVTVLESQAIGRQEFYEKLDQTKKEIIEAFEKKQTQDMRYKTQD